MGRKKVVNDTEVALLHDEGMRVTDIAEKLLVSRATINNSLKRTRANLPARAIPLDPVKFKERELEITGKEKAQVATLFHDMLLNINITDPTVNQLKVLGDLWKLFNNEERLMRGESTQNIGVAKRIYINLNDEEREQIDALEKKLDELDKSRIEREVAEEIEEGVIV